MKRIILIVILFSLNKVDAQTTQSEWRSQFIQTKTNLNTILMEFCPANISIDSFKVALIQGIMAIPGDVKKSIESVVKSLSTYGQEVIKKFNLPVDMNDVESDLYYYAGISPNNPKVNEIPVLVKSEYTQRAETSGGGLLNCVAHALGADALLLLGTSNTSTWTWPVIKRSFKTIAKKMLGPIGVAIAVIDFGLCMADIL